MGCIGSDHSSILCPGDSGSRSTSGGAGEGPRLSVKCKLSDIGGTCTQHIGIGKLHVTATSDDVFSYMQYKRFHCAIFLSMS